MQYPKMIGSYLAGEERRGSEECEKRDPATGEFLATLSCASPELIQNALQDAVRAHRIWSALSLDKRAAYLARVIALIEEKQDEIVELVARESGRSKKHTLGEVAGAAKGGAALLKEAAFLAPRTIPSANPKREVTLMRTSVGVGALFTPFNSPFVLVAGKAFPALLCGNAVILKAHELAPYAPVLFAKLCTEAGIPSGVVSVLQGGTEVGQRLIADPRIQFVSFTGSSKGGAAILSATAPRLTRVSIEAGGKNPMVVCADADLEKALTDATASITVDAGQRCASTSRLILLSDIYDEFKAKLVERFSTLTVGVGEASDLGMVISEDRLTSILGAVDGAVARGASLLTGGVRVGEGYGMQPTILENVSPDDPLSQTELFGPIVILYRVDSLDEAIAIANNSPYRLSSAIHTKDMKAAEYFAREHGAGVTRINGPTFGSEPHMPFGGERLSGNGWREPGVEALNFYSSLRQISWDQA